MKPIEIHIEGYKIVITEDKEEPKITIKDHDAKPGDTIEYKPCQPYVVPCCPTPNTPQPDDWWRYPYVTWTNDDTFNLNSTSAYPTPVRDTMVGKATGGTVKTGEPHIIGECVCNMEIDTDKGTKCGPWTKGEKGEPGTPIVGE